MENESCIILKSIICSVLLSDRPVCSHYIQYDFATFHI